MLLCCEEGETAYDPAVLRNVTVVTAEDQEQLTPAFLEAERRKLEHMDFVLSSALRNLEFGPVSDMAPQTAWFEAEHLLAGRKA